MQIDMLQFNPRMDRFNLRPYFEIPSAIGTQGDQRNTFANVECFQNKFSLNMLFK
jgi:hypothetical protein